MQLDSNRNRTDGISLLFLACVTALAIRDAHRGYRGRGASSQIFDWIRRSLGPRPSRHNCHVGPRRTMTHALRPCPVPFPSLGRVPGFNVQLCWRNFPFEKILWLWYLERKYPFTVVANFGPPVKFCLQHFYLYDMYVLTSNS